MRVSACQSMGTPVACACMCALVSDCVGARVPKLGVRVHLEVLAYLRVQGLTVYLPSHSFANYQTRPVPHADQVVATSAMYVLYSVLSVDMPPFEPRKSFRDWSIMPSFCLQDAESNGLGPRNLRRFLLYPQSNSRSSTETG